VASSRGDDVLAAGQLRGKLYGGRNLICACALTETYIKAAE
jgi:hypothetical protein